VQFYDNLDFPNHKVFCLLLPKGMGAVFFNKGENCIAAGRLFVEESIHDEFVTRMVSIFRFAL